jgi:hypothetical protein
VAAGYEMASCHARHGRDQLTHGASAQL